MTRSLLAVLLVAGCGRVDDEVTLVSLSNEDALSLCAEYHRNAQTIQCDDGSSIQVTESDDQVCADNLAGLPASCAATASNYRDCYDALESQSPCEPFTQYPDECEWLIDTTCIRTN